MRKHNAKAQLSEFVQKQRDERYAFGWQQHKDLLDFKQKQIQERQQFIDTLKGGNQC